MAGDDYKLSSKRWFHGETTSRKAFDDQRWDRDRSMASPNENGPGLYFTSSQSEARNYGPFVYEALTRSNFRLLHSKVKPTRRLLRDLWVSANKEDRQIFLDNWNTTLPAEAFEQYAKQHTAFAAAVSLYGDLIRRPGEWVEAMRFAGFDGTVIDRALGVKHLVVWSPEKLVIRELPPGGV